MSQRYGTDRGISYLPDGRWACILLVRILKDAEVQGARCAFTFPRHGPLFSLYHLSIDYTQAPPPPPFSKEELAWLSQCIRKRL